MVGRVAVEGRVPLPKDWVQWQYSGDFRLPEARFFHVPGWGKGRLSTIT